MLESPDSTESLLQSWSQRVVLCQFASFWSCVVLCQFAASFSESLFDSWRSGLTTGVRTSASETSSSGSAWSWRLSQTFWTTTRSYWTLSNAAQSRRPPSERFWKDVNGNPRQKCWRKGLVDCMWGLFPPWFPLAFIALLYVSMQPWPRHEHFLHLSVAINQLNLFSLPQFTRTSSGACQKSRRLRDPADVVQNSHTRRSPRQSGLNKGNEKAWRSGQVVSGRQRQNSKGSRNCPAANQDHQMPGKHWTQNCWARNLITCVSEMWIPVTQGQVCLEGLARQEVGIFWACQHDFKNCRFQLSWLVFSFYFPNYFSCCWKQTGSFWSSWMSHIWKAQRVTLFRNLGLWLRFLVCDVGRYFLTHIFAGCTNTLKRLDCSSSTTVCSSHGERQRIFHSKGKLNTFIGLKPAHLSLDWKSKTLQIQNVSDRWLFPICSPKYLRGCRVNQRTFGFYSGILWIHFQLPSRCSLPGGNGSVQVTLLKRNWTGSVCWNVQSDLLWKHDEISSARQIYELFFNCWCSILNFGK